MKKKRQYNGKYVNFAEHYIGETSANCSLSYLNSSKTLNDQTTYLTITQSNSSRNINDQTTNKWCKKS